MKKKSIVIETMEKCCPHMVLHMPDITGNPRDFQCLDYHNEKEQVEVLKN